MRNESIIDVASQLKWSWKLSVWSYESIIDVASQLKWSWKLSVPLNRSKPSLASVVACMMPFMMGVCFLCPSMDCLWHKYHYCPNCGEKVGPLPTHHAVFYRDKFCFQVCSPIFLCWTLQVGEFRKSDPCLVVDAPRWSEPSFAVPA